jgi:F0F1-type ATP synthase alpha subunit
MFFNFWLWVLDAAVPVPMADKPLIIGRMQTGQTIVNLLLPEIK